MKQRFVISCKRKKHILTHEILPEEEREWLYLCRDSGPLGSGLLVFAENPSDMCYFKSLEEAKEYWDRYCCTSSYLRGFFIDDDYDSSTLGVRKVVHKFCKPLNFCIKPTHR